MNGTIAETAAIDDLPTHDLQALLDELRARSVRRMPPGARVVLSARCPGPWYLDWFRQNYPGTIARHIVVEPQQPRPALLPSEVQWLSTSPTHMDSVGTAEVDLVFADRLLERSWPDEVTGFLSEAHRVLRPGGWVVLDSPNRRFVGRGGWVAPDHALEYTAEEAVELLDLAGFAEIEVRGLWLCHDPQTCRQLPLEPAAEAAGWDCKRRVAVGENHPEACLFWWVQARRGEQAPDAVRLLARCRDIYHSAWPTVVGRSFHVVGKVEGIGRNRLVRTAQGEGGCIKHGPYVLLRPGRYQVTFAIGCPVEAAGVPFEDVVCQVDVISAASRIHNRRLIAYGELGGGRLQEFPVPFELTASAAGLEFRIISTGRVALFARYHPDFVALTPEVESASHPHEQSYQTATDLIWKELEVLQTRYNQLGTLISQLHGH